MIRFFDILFSFIGLIVLSPIFIIIGLLIIVESKGGMFYQQKRVGKNGIEFTLVKFRSMAKGTDKKGLLTIGTNDSRITKTGKFIRKYKIDELPQLINVLIGTMSLVGPRPEVKKYTDLYTDEQRKIMSVKPGITDYASLEYINENEILGQSANPEKVYIEEVMPAKIALNMKYINNISLIHYLKIIVLTILAILGYKMPSA
jgi:lipopolysaccharide/colanic/teichoic acid biosynthesis glycosyltransferase